MQDKFEEFNPGTQIRAFQAESDEKGRHSDGGMDGGTEGGGKQGDARGISTREND